MKYKLTPRLKRVVFLRNIAGLSTLIGIPFAIYKTLPFLNVDGILFWILFSIASLLGVFFTFRLLESIIVIVVYGSDIKLMQEDSEMVMQQHRQRLANEDEDEDEDSALVTKNAEDIVAMEFTIVETPAEPIGKYYDSPIWEWIKLKSPKGNLVIAHFADTVDPKELKKFAIPNEHLLLPPGVLYSLEFPENEESVNKTG